MRPDRRIGVSPVERVNERRPGRLVVLLAFLAGGALFVRDVVYPAAQRLWDAEVAPRLAGEAPASARRVPSPDEASDPRRVPPVAHPQDLPEAEANRRKCWPAPEVAANVNADELGRLGLSEREVDDIVAFLRTLDDGYLK